MINGKLRDLYKYIERKEIELSHAGPSKIYVNVKKAIGDDPALREEICTRLVDSIMSGVDCVVGSGLGGYSLAAIIADRKGLYLTQVRLQPKDHGSTGQIEGHVPTKENRICLVDDVLTTGKSIEKTIDILKPTGATIVGCHVVVNRGGAKTPYPLTCLMTLEELMKCAP